MMQVSQPGEDGRVVLSLGNEEAAILLQPGGIFRSVLDDNPDWADESQFLTPPKTAGGMLAVLPRQAATAWLAAIATHPVEREFQELLIQIINR